MQQASAPQFRDGVAEAGAHMRSAKYKSQDLICCGCQCSHTHAPWLKIQAESHIHIRRCRNARHLFGPARRSRVQNYWARWSRREFNPCLGPASTAHRPSGACSANSLPRPLYARCLSGSMSSAQHASMESFQEAEASWLCNSAPGARNLRLEQDCHRWGGTGWHCHSLPSVGMLMSDA